MRTRQIVAAVTIVLSAFLLFVVEPLSSKELLPKLGGSSGVWLSCLCFFQIFLLFGYLYALLLTGWMRQQTSQRVHLGALVVAVCWVVFRLHVSSDVTVEAGSSSTWTIFKVLMLQLGFPFLLLSATSPMLQVWLARWNRHGVLFRLFALSNLGSVLALLMYPAVIEPYITLHLQREMWAFAL